MSTDTRMTARDHSDAIVRGTALIGRAPERTDVPAGSTVTVLPHPVPGYVSLTGEDPYGDAFLFVVRESALDDVAPVVPVHIPDGKSIGSVWSSYGHTFVGTGEYDTDDDGRTLGAYVSCMTCGAEYVERPTVDGGWNENGVTIIRGEYLTNAGEPAAECSGDVRMVHGYGGEREGVCAMGNEHPTDADGLYLPQCEHCRHDCPCIRCNS